MTPTWSFGFGAIVRPAADGERLMAATWNTRIWCKGSSIRREGDDDSLPELVAGDGRAPVQMVRCCAGVGAVVMDERGGVTVFRAGENEGVAVCAHGACCVGVTMKAVYVVFSDTGQVAQFNLCEEALTAHAVVMPERCTSVACGPRFCAAVAESGRVYSWGDGSHGQLGHGDVNGRTEPTLIEALSNVSVVAAATGYWHTMFLTDDGDVYACGWDEHGQLGLGDVPAAVNRALPNLVELPDEALPVRAIACGSKHSVALTAAGDLYTWGWGAYGQLGYPTSLPEHAQRLPRKVRVTPGHVPITSILCAPWTTYLN